MHGLWQLTWLEIKIFVREPLGLIGTVVVPVVVVLGLGRMFGGRVEANGRLSTLLGADLPVLAMILVALNAVLSLITIIAIYRESGILKRLRATPLRPHTILTAHVLTKLFFTVVTLGAVVAAGRRFYPVDLDVPWGSLSLALVVTTISILSIGFLIASLVPTARFAQPIGTLLLYPMLGVSGLFVPPDSLPSAVQSVAQVLPLTFAVSFLRGIWTGGTWWAHGWDLAGLAVVFVICTALSARVFRWE